MRRTYITLCGAALLASAAWATDPATKPVPGTQPDNTGVNVRDSDGTSKTAFDQGESEADRNITAAIRKRVVDDDALSTNAHNVKIITENGLVVLRGPVDSASEKAAVEAMAKSVAGVKQVTSQLEIVSAK